MRIKMLHPAKWIPKFQEFLEDLFDEEDDEELEQVEQAAGMEPVRKYPWAWNLFHFLNLVLSIMTILPILSYTSSHWTIHHVGNTREMHEHILVTAVFLVMGMLFLHVAFPKIMQTLLFGGVLVLGILPLISEKHSFAEMWIAYREQVKSLPVQLEDRIQGHLYHSDEVERKLVRLISKNVDHHSLQKFLEDVDVGEDWDWSTCLSLYQLVYDAWTYKSDPFYKELYKPPHKTIRSFSGDCDDYTLLVSVLFKTLDYQVRIIVTNHHVYPELAIPHDSIYFSRIVPLIKAMPGYQQEGSPPLFFHRDRTGTIWLNLDYTAPYPGGPFMHEHVYKVIDLNGL